ncbi:MAG TPA: crosslink repair DNA glycosylase YcaQ family protein [Casimicrobiaceae bacterium]|nr:crosslink repair DNA glycosylase YcaQ family protein [Casimicrobiaceae bacterium]
MEQLRNYAVARTLFSPRDLEAAVRTLGFVQLDPIRAPARAQDLILRHRVSGYRAGDLEKHYPSLPLVEEQLHVYGVLPRDSLRLLHPRPVRDPWHVEREHPRLAKRILAYVGRHGPTHPRELQKALGVARVVNGWGGESIATTRMLEVLHYRGRLRIARRDKGVKVYELPHALPKPLAAAERTAKLLDLVLHLYAPLPERSLRELAAIVTRTSLPGANAAKAVARLIEGDRIRRAIVDGVMYVWPAGEELQVEAHDNVRLLAPFDPIVWDRRRFELFWGWAYRFEAYTPPARRRLGYYALPLLWRDAVVGWANAAMAGGALVVETGFTAKRPRDAAFRRELDAEIQRMSAFLGVPVGKVMSR